MEELFLRAFHDVAHVDIDERFVIHVYNALDLAGCTIVEAFDRERQGIGRPAA